MKLTLEERMIDTFNSQLGAVISEFESGLSKSQYSDASDIFTSTQISDLQTRCLAAIERTSGLSSTYHQSAVTFGKESNDIYYQVANQIGVAKALLSDINNGYLKSFEEVLHSSVFSDFLEMADYLLQKGFKDPAAVIAGSTLEVHLKKMCSKFAIDTETNGKPEKANSLNEKLRKQGAYKTLDQKSVTAWLDLRNKAAHGDFSEYETNQVRLLISSIRDFITRHPA